MLRDRQQDAAEVHAEGAGMETGIHEEAGHWVRRDGLTVDGGDEHACGSIGAAGTYAQNEIVAFVLLPELPEVGRDLLAITIGLENPVFVRVVEAVAKSFAMSAVALGCDRMQRRQFAGKPS